MAICSEATALRCRGKLPVTVRLGHAQVVALETIRPLGNTLQAQVSTRLGAGFLASGEAMESGSAELVTLRVERVPHDSWLLVTEG
jgi:hypothetical protein